MAANKFNFKEQQKEHAAFREVCAECGKVKGGKDQAGAVTQWAYGLEYCACQTKTPNGNFALAPASSHQTSTQDGNDATKTDLGDRYEIVELIGQGGMGSVYRARDKVLGKDFAVKVLRQELAVDESAAKRFEQEATAASDLTHMNMVAVYGHGKTATGAPYIVMDLLEGESLAQLLKREHHLSPARMMDIAVQICDALAHAHMKGFVHRDLKPSNIMLVKNDQSLDKVKVLDFGIAKLMPSANRETQNLTQTGELFGSPSYMSPEQCLACNQDARSDIYALGCMMYEMLSGKPPFDGKNPIQTVVRHINEEPPPLKASLLSGKAGTGLRTAIMRCLEKSADERYQSMDLLKAELQLIASGQAPKTKTKRISKPVSFVIPGLLTVILIATSLIANSPHVSWQYATLQSIQSTLSLICPLSWILALSQLWWSHIRQKLKQPRTLVDYWRITTLTLLLLGCASMAGLHGSYGPYPFFGPCSVYSVSYLCAVSAFLSALIAALGWGLAKIASKRTCSQAQQKMASAIYLVMALCALALLRPQLAWIPYSVGTRTAYAGSKEGWSLPNLGYEVAILLNPDFAEAYLTRGTTKTMDPAGALNDYTKAISLNPEKPLLGEALIRRADLYLERKQYDQAILDINEVLKIPPPFKEGYNETTPEQVYLLRARCYEGNRQNDRALADCEKVLSLDSTYSQAYNLRGRLHDAMGKAQDALANYSSAIQWSPDNLGYYLDRAKLNTKLGRHDLAAKDFKQVLEQGDKAFKHGFRDGNDAPRLRAAATAAKALGMEKQAAEYSAKALELEKQFSG